MYSSPCAAGRPREQLAPGERPWFAGAILAGGVVGPALLMLGLSGMAASEAALLLNAEAVFTALIAWVVFRENLDLRVGLAKGRDEGGDSVAYLRLGRAF